MRVVYPIPVSFQDGKVDIVSTFNYVNYLKENGAKTLMTTAGTSQYNLMNKLEIKSLNDLLIDNNDTPIIGIPMLSLEETLEEINYLNNKKCYPMILYPDRFYTEDNICEFFELCANASINPIYLHGMYMRKGNGGTWDYTPSVINRLSKHPNIKGMKEESSSLDVAHNLCKNIEDDDFDIILAGGSQKRHWFLSSTRENSFLSGLGSVWPQLDERYMDHYNNGELKKAEEVIKYYEIPFFNVFMKIGWHASLRYALQLKGFIKENRAPFINLNDNQKKEIEKIINLLDGELV